MVDLYVKDTDRNNLLSYQSCHPKAVKKAIPCSQFDRVRRIVSDPDICSQRLDEIENTFLDRGYPRQVLRRCRNIENRDRSLEPSVRIPLVHTFHPYMYKLHHKIRKHWHILKDSFPKIPEFQAPFLPCFRRPNNLKNKIVRSDVGSPASTLRQTFLQTPRRGTFPCLQCAQCANVLRGHKISHPLTGADIPIRGFFTCQSTQVVYAIKCPCGKIYVGETSQAIKDRISHHKSDIRCGKFHLPIPYHFREGGHSIAQLRFLVLEQISLNRRGDKEMGGHHRSPILQFAQHSVRSAISLTSLQAYQHLQATRKYSLQDPDAALRPFWIRELQGEDSRYTFDHFSFSEKKLQNVLLGNSETYCQKFIK
ncbi:unnamed protein product [Ranitomeya imitator]|uniref:Helix-turn-helix domain-containing protein n=1 Tax=Ranitomeya imitator TaxID=111125 RepID=A0ABN9M009_9NEOB|nr:unnamed protein product [Ranitomeya imitator]